jgi:15-cis-phytoene desaturase
MVPVAIVGGGVAGLACAVALADRGVPSVVLEREPSCGGRAGHVRHEATGDVLDLGPQVLTSACTDFVALLDRLGTARHIHWQEDPALVLGASSGRYALKLFRDLLRFPGLTWRDLLSNVNPLRDALGMDARRFERLDSITGLEALRRMQVSPRSIDGAWRFASIALLATPLERVSAAALLRAVGGLVSNRRLRFGYPARPLDELFVPGATRVVEAAGGRVRTHWEVVGIDRHEDRWRLWGHHGARIEAARVVKALPPFGASLQPAPYVSTCLWLDRKVADDAAWSLLPKPGRRHVDFQDLSRIREGWEDRGSIIACNAAHPGSFIDADTDDVVRIALHELASFAPAAREARVLHAEIHRIPMAVPCAVPGFEALRPPSRTDEPGLYVAGDWTDTGLPCSLESAVKSGRMAAEAIVEDLSRSLATGEADRNARLAA